MKILNLLPVVIVLGTVTPRVQAAQIIATTFDTDRQDWYPTFPAGTGTGNFWLSSGGNPGGFVRSTDRAGFELSGPWYFENSTTFAGNRSAAYGGTLAYDLKRFVDGTLLTGQYDVKLSGAGLELVYQNATAPTAGAWTNYVITLNETAGWKIASLAGLAPTQAQFQSVLAGLQTIDIRGDYNVEHAEFVNDITGLDNVSLNSPGISAVPEPSTLISAGTAALMGLGIGWRRRWRAAGLDR